MISAVVIFLSAITVSNACVATTTTTTTAACCSMLSVQSLPRRSPSLSTQQQCSVLQRVSSTCPEDGIVVCDAAPDTNPSAILIEFFSSSGTVVRSQSVTGSVVDSLTVKVVCVNGAWRVPTATGSSTNVAISSVSCSQTGSVGVDRGYDLSGTAY